MHMAARLDPGDTPRELAWHRCCGLSAKFFSKWPRGWPLGWRRNSVVGKGLAWWGRHGCPDGCPDGYKRMVVGEDERMVQAKRDMVIRFWLACGCARPPRWPRAGQGGGQGCPKDTSPSGQMRLVAGGATSPGDEPRRGRCMSVQTGRDVKSPRDRGWKLCGS